MGKNILAIIIVAVIAVIGYAAYQYSDSPTPEDAMMEDEGMMMEEDDNMMEKGEMMEEESMMKLEFSGQVLAGTESPLLDFNKSDYDKAVASDN